MLTVHSRTLPEVLSAAELARATRTSIAEVQAWIEAGAIRTLTAGDGFTWIARKEAIAAGRAIARGTIATRATGIATSDGMFASRTRGGVTRLRAPLALSGGVHAGVFAALLLVTSIGLGGATTSESPVDSTPLRMVYLPLPGPAGGGGGGGLHQAAPPPRARRKGSAHIDSPVPTAKPPAPAPRKTTPQPSEPLKAPVAQAAANNENRDGQIAPAPPIESRGPGDAGGVGTGAGLGIGEGTGAGIGDGEDAGTGGGPFRPGSGIEPPSIRHEVKPDYTEDARRRNARGDVILEIVVKRDGSVGDVHVLRRLGYGLDERAVDAVRQWTFNPATRKGVPVDVLVEVAMEFRLR